MDTIPQGIKTAISNITAPVVTCKKVLTKGYGFSNDEKKRRR